MDEQQWDFAEMGGNIDDPEPIDDEEDDEYEDLGCGGHGSQ